MILRHRHFSSFPNLNLSWAISLNYYFSSFPFFSLFWRRCDHSSLHLMTLVITKFFLYFLKLKNLMEVFVWFLLIETKIDNSYPTKWVSANTRIDPQYLWGFFLGLITKIVMKKYQRMGFWDIKHGLKNWKIIQHLCNQRFFDWFEIPRINGYSISIFSHKKLELVVLWFWNILKFGIDGY
jgi:hypothetical protein